MEGADCYRPVSPTFTARDLRDWRERMGWTQQQAADRLMTICSTYVGWERRRNPPQLVVLACAYLEKQCDFVVNPDTKTVIAERVANLIAMDVAYYLEQRLL